MRRPAPTFVTLPSGVMLHYRIQGEPGAPWMVLLNGLLSDTTMWDGAPSAIARRSRSESGSRPHKAACDRGVVKALMAQGGAR